MSDFALTYDDVTLVPNYSEVRSRQDPDPSVELMGIPLSTPIISANMDTITGSEMAIAMWKAGGIGALHRFMSVEKNVEEFVRVREAGAMCLNSLGTKDWDERTAKLHSAGARHFVIDIAHGHSILVKEMIDALKQKYGEDIKIMAGNVATAQAVDDMQKWGADAVKVGIGGGSICTTRLITGFGVPMFTSVKNCSGRGMQVVADGGIRTSGDIVKALVAGADVVMVGRLLAGTLETPGDVVDGVKAYRGMSSASTRQRIGSTALAEGVDAVVTQSGSACERVRDLTAGLKSGMSYAGAMTLRELQDFVGWMQQTPHGTIEGTPHILK